MSFFSAFLLVSVFYPKRKINSFVEKRSEILLENEQIGFVKMRTKKRETDVSLAHSTYVISEYLQLQEIRLLCKKNRRVDWDSVLTVIEAIASLVTVIPGIIQLFGK